MPTAIVKINTACNPAFAEVEVGGGATVVEHVASYAALPSAASADSEFRICDLEQILVISMFNQWVVIATTVGGGV